MNCLVKFSSLLVLHLAVPTWGVAAESEALPAGPRQIAVKEFVSHPPLVATEAKTFDPVDLARESWKGWISKRGIPCPARRRRIRAVRRESREPESTGSN